MIIGSESLRKYLVYGRHQDRGRYQPLYLSQNIPPIRVARKVYGTQFRVIPGHEDQLEAFVQRLRDRHPDWSFELREV